jgi:hypothetical protein
VTFPKFELLRSAVGLPKCGVLVMPDANRERRAEFHQRILTIAPERLIFLDESGVMAGRTRRRGIGSCSVAIICSHSHAQAALC